MYFNFITYVCDVVWRKYNYYAWYNLSLGLQLWPPYNFSSSHAPVMWHTACRSCRFRSHALDLTQYTRTNRSHERIWTLYKIILTLNSNPAPTTNQYPLHWVPYECLDDKYRIFLCFPTGFRHRQRLIHPIEFYLPAPCYGLTNHTMLAFMQELHQLVIELGCDPSDCSISDVYIQCPSVEPTAQFYREVLFRSGLKKKKWVFIKLYWQLL